jgi:hypothetical protein
MKNLFKPTTRKYIYGLVAAVVPILVSLNGLGPDIAAAILTIAAAVLAISNVSDAE